MEIRWENERTGMMKRRWGKEVEVETRESRERKSWRMCACNRLLHVSSRHLWGLHQVLCVPMLLWGIIVFITSIRCDKSCYNYQWNTPYSAHTHIHRLMHVHTQGHKTGLFELFSIFFFLRKVHWGYLSESLSVHAQSHVHSRTHSGTHIHTYAHTLSSIVPHSPALFTTMHTSVQVWTACLSTEMHSWRIPPPTHWQVVPNLWDFDRWQIKSQWQLLPL